MVMIDALYEYRRSDLADFTAFCRMLEEARNRLRAKEREPHPRVTEDIYTNGPLNSYETDVLLPRQESFASLHILTRRASEGSEALPSLARRVRMSFFGARVIDHLYVQIATGELRYRKADQALTDFARLCNVENSHAFASIPQWQSVFSQELAKTISSLDKSTVTRVFKAILEISQDPLKLKGDTLKKLTGNLKGHWRYRVGDRRLLFRVDSSNKLIMFIDCLPRSSAYDD